MGKVIIDFTENQLREIFTEAGLETRQIERAIADYFRYRERELSVLSLLSYRDLQSIGAEAIAEEVSKVRPGDEIATEILKDYLRYLNHKKRIAETYHESKSWDKVRGDPYQDDEEATEAFIDYVEETYQTKVKDAKHLQKLTGITEETLEELEGAIIKAKYSRYSRALGIAIREGTTYKELLQIKPKAYGLPETWSGCLGSDQYSSLLWAMGIEIGISEPRFLRYLPDLRSIAKELQAPYSVLMDCYNLTNRYKEYGDTGN